MNNEKYNQIIDEAYKSYRKEINQRLENWIDIQEDDIYEGTSLHDYTRKWTKEEFINKCKTDSEFSERWGLKIEERELSLEERYNIWFNNNYETGMERYFDPNNLPDFDNEYYEPTPTKSITVTYNDIKTEIYE